MLRTSYFTYMFTKYTLLLDGVLGWERKKDIFTFSMILELKRAHCLSRAPRATYPQESKAHTQTLIRRTEALWMLLLGSFVCHVLLSQEESWFWSSPHLHGVKHHTLVLSTFTDKLCAYKILSRHFDVFVVSPKCHRWAKYHQHIVIFVSQTVESLYIMRYLIYIETE